MRIMEKLRNSICVKRIYNQKAWKKEKKSKYDGNFEP